jgi:hypothetical protein
LTEEQRLKVQSAVAALLEEKKSVLTEAHTVQYYPDMVNVGENFYLLIGGVTRDGNTTQNIIVVSEKEGKFEFEKIVNA